MSDLIIDYFQDLLAAYPHFRPTDPDRTIDVYERGLEDLSDHQLRPAIDHLIRSGGKFFPTVAEIRATVRRLNPQAPRRPWVVVVQDLYDRAFAGDFDEQEWRRLIKDLSSAGRENLAGQAEQKLAGLLAGPDPEAGDRYRQDLEWIREFETREVGIA